MTYLIVAYVIIFAALFGYVFSLARRQRDLQREIEDLKRPAQQPASPVRTREEAVSQPHAQ